MDKRTTEVVVVGAGFAGLAAAQVLGRGSATSCSSVLDQHETPKPSTPTTS
jgi:cation diffusion facilitator CzcD-associated flavoprotein CzcO